MLWLHEAVRTGAGAITGEVAALVAMAAGVWLVAHRTPQVAQGDGGREEGGAPEERSGRTASAARP
jgi:hypothetical protein